MRSVVLVPILLLVSCATPPTYWNKPGATQTDFERDRYECIREAMGVVGPQQEIVVQQDPSPYYYTPPAAAFGQGIARGMRQGDHNKKIMDFAALCMRSRGYTPQTVE